jgi:hypothetical protein
MLVAEYSSGNVGAYEVDDNGNPIVAAPARNNWVVVSGYNAASAGKRHRRLSRLQLTVNAFSLAPRLAAAVEFQPPFELFASNIIRCQLNSLS